MTSETDSRKRADAEAVAWKFKYEKAEQEKLYAQTHQKTVEVAVEKKVPYEKCEKCDRTAYRKAKEKCDSRKSQLEKKYKNMTIGYESILFLLAWYSITTTLFTAILSPVFLNDCIVSLLSCSSTGIRNREVYFSGVCVSRTQVSEKTSSLRALKAIWSARHQTSHVFFRILRGTPTLIAAYCHEQTLSSNNPVLLIQSGMARLSQVGKQILPEILVGIDSVSDRGLSVIHEAYTSPFRTGWEICDVKSA